MKTSPVFALALASAAALVVQPVAAQDIIVAPPSRQAYANEVTEDLQAHIDRFPFSAWNAKAGIASVRFEAGEDGRARNVRTVHSSGDPALDMAARMIARRLTSLAPLPRGERGATIQANIVLAKDAATRDRMVASLKRSEPARLALGGAETRVLVLTGIMSPRS